MTSEDAGCRNHDRIQRSHRPKEGCAALTGPALPLMLGTPLCPASAANSRLTSRVVGDPGGCWAGAAGWVCGSDDDDDGAAAARPTEPLLVLTARPTCIAVVADARSAAVLKPGGLWLPPLLTCGLTSRAMRADAVIEV